MLLGALAAHAAARPARKPLTAKPDLVNNFAALAQNRPRACVPATPVTGVAGWQVSQTECAWQNRLQVRRWSPAPNPQLACVSSPATWWAWVQPRRAAAAPAWRTAWTSHSLIDDSAPQQRIALVERAASGAWSATEWTWNPSPRPATRRWQEGRWKLLAEAARARQPQPAADAAPAETRMLRTAWESNLGRRAGEVNGDSWQWLADGLCMRAEPIGLSVVQHLPYLFADGRLEQRAAMQVQLARRFPKATWLTPFRLVPSAAARGEGGAKFEAVWIDNAALKGQLWIPTKNDGPVVRVRISTSLPAPAVTARAAEALERELAGLASQWASAHE